jgi:hypothetical protein
MARGYMAKNLETIPFTKHVLTCIKRELGDQGREVELNIKPHPGAGIEVQLIEGEERYFLLATWTEMEKLQKQSPYSLDKMLINKLRNAGFEFTSYESNYLHTVLHIG